MFTHFYRQLGLPIHFVELIVIVIVTVYIDLLNEGIVYLDMLKLFFFKIKAVMTLKISVSGNIRLIIAQMKYYIYFS